MFKLTSSSLLFSPLHSKEKLFPSSFHSSAKKEGGGRGGGGQQWRNEERRSGNERNPLSFRTHGEREREEEEVPKNSLYLSHGRLFSSLSQGLSVRLSH